MWSYSLSSFIRNFGLEKLYEVWPASQWAANALITDRAICVAGKYLILRHGAIIYSRKASPEVALMYIVEQGG